MRERADYIRMVEHAPKVLLCLCVCVCVCCVCVCVYVYVCKK